jgi:ring-1,2-phenylacetyl-CoA epoxidase subunit PaaB
MTSRDTQWPRYQVFHQEGPDRPHVNSGSVHATDSEMALQNARDVFVRRPGCVSLWVVPAAEIHSITADEIERTGLPKPKNDDGDPETYQVFLKETQIGSHGHVGSVQAASPADGLAAAVVDYGKQSGIVWWIVPDASIVRTDPDEIESLFQPATSKLYRDQSFYHTVTLMRRLREKKGLSK